MKVYKISSEKIGLPEGIYDCRASFMSYPFILNVDNYDMTDEEVINWMNSEEPYTLEVYDNSDYIYHGQGD